MKRWISLLLCLALTGSLLPFALAEEESADTRLKRVTERVKTTLDLDTDRYTDFQGSLSEQELGSVWNLNWSGDSGNMSIEALEDGSIVSYWVSDGKDSYVYSRNLPAFPAADPSKARAAAASFLGRVLDGRTEAVRLKEPEERQLRSSSVRFYGTILLNGLPSPLTYSITVRGEDNTVTSFRRDAPSRSFLGNIPSPVPAVAKADAAGKLRETEELELRYVLAESEAGEAPVLRYVPITEGTWAVDAQTGEARDISGGGIGIYTRNTAAEPEEAAMDAGSGMTMKSLNAVEQAGVEKLEGVLDQSALDRAVRSETAYQLTDAYTVQSAHYRLVREDDGKGGEREAVLCTLRYTAGQAGEETPLFGAAVPDLPDRTFTVDARTGAVRMLYSSERWDRSQDAAVTAASALETAKNFLIRFAAAAPVDAKKVERYGTEDGTGKGAASYSFTFARKENGVLFPTDSVNIRIDCMTGAVSGVNYTWHEFLTEFPSPSGIVPQEAALSAWVKTYDTVLAYRLLPRDLDASRPEEAKLIAIGMTRFYDLFLSYRLERPEGTAYADFSGCPGIDAKTGKPVETPVWTAEKLAYDDIEGNSAEADIRKLADYGIGYAGGAFGPEKALTQWDLVCLLASVQGMRLDPERAGEEERNGAYQTAAAMGALDRGERDEKKVLNRGQTVKMLLNAAGYGTVARIEGIYQTAYADSADIPAGDLGYAALAQGLHMVQGRYDAGAVLKRADAASLLCRLMERPV